MQADTIVVITQGTAAGRDLLPLWTGLLGGILGLAATLWAGRNSRSATREQIIAQRDIAKDQLREQAEANRLQLQATIVSANRLKWIDTLRAEVAAFCGAVIAIATDVGNDVEVAAIYAKIDKANHHATLIKLLVDHENSDCRELVAAVDRVSDLVSTFMPPINGHIDHDDVDKHVTSIGDMTRAIAKAEWDRAQKFQ